MLTVLLIVLLVLVLAGALGGPVYRRRRGVVVEREYDV